MWWAKKKSLGFIAVQLKVVAAHSCLYLLETDGKRRQGCRGGRSGTDVELCVISIAMEGYPMSADDTTKGSM